MGREDDLMNVAGHRLSSGAMEEVVMSHKSVAECAVIGIPDELKGEIPVGLVVVKDGSGGGGSMEEEDLAFDLVRLVREKIGPVAFFKHVIVVKRLPKTRSGKTLRQTIRKLSEFKVGDIRYPPTIDDPSCLWEIAEHFKENSIGPLYDGTKKD